MKECLGCGEPPVRDDDPSRTLWVDGKSPLQRYRETGFAFVNLGYGANRRNWIGCPRYYSAFSDATIAGVPTLAYIQRAYWAQKRGMLAQFVEPPYTSALVELLALYDALESEAEYRARKEAQKGA